MATYPIRQADAQSAAQPLAPGRLWRQLSAERRQAVSQAFWSDTEGAEQHAEALVWLAKQLNFRLKSVQRLPAERKARYLASSGGVPDTVVVRALVTYHLREKRQMMGAFLDKLGIAHDNGVIAVEGLEAPEAEKLGDAATALAADYPAEDVHLYFSTLVAQDPDTWGGLAKFVTHEADGKAHG